MSRNSFNVLFNNKVTMRMSQKKEVEFGITTAYSDKNRKSFSAEYREKIAKQDCYGCQREGMI